MVKYITRIFFLLAKPQGSTVGRQISEEERARGAVRKDLDLELDGVRLKFGRKKEAFLTQLKKVGSMREVLGVVTSFDAILSRIRANRTLSSLRN